MKQKLILTQKEFDELQRLLKIVNDKNNLPGERRLARAKFDLMYNKAARRSSSLDPGNNRSELEVAGLKTSH